MTSQTLETLPRAYPRSFVPAELEVRGFDDVQPLFDQLLQADISTPAALEAWLANLTELESVIGEVGSRTHILTTLDTANPEYKRAFMEWVENFEPRLKPIFDQLNRKFAASPAREQLNSEIFGLYQRGVLTRLELYREANVPLETEVSKLTNQYDEIMGGLTIDFDGREYTPQQIAKLQLEPDRDLRERAWRATAERRLRDKSKLDALYDKQVRLREKMAANAGFSNYRDFQFKAFLRYDYTPEDCHAFAEAVEKVVIPAEKRILERRRKDMKLETLRPWDLAVGTHGREALKPFDDVEQLKAGCSSIFHKVDPELGSQFDRMRELGLLDLDNRKGKAPGGYQSTLTEVRLPFIFMNAVGVDSDLRTLLHEGGHAFHAFAAAEQPLSEYRSAPMEFCEVASMSMELLGLPHSGEFYQGDDLKRAREEFFSGIVGLFGSVAQIDQFQHWTYTNPGCRVEQREAKWLELNERFMPGIDWTGLEDARAMGWQRVGHLFWVPFYYIEYAIAQIGALQVWLNSKRDQTKALADYRYALSLGGSKGLRQLFTAAGLKFGMDADTLKPLIEAIEAEL